MVVFFSILLFSLLIFVHELGHFIAAKLFGVQVNEFSIFMNLYEKDIRKHYKEDDFTLKKYFADEMHALLSNPGDKYISWGDCAQELKLLESNTVGTHRIEIQVTSASPKDDFDVLGLMVS